MSLRLLSWNILQGGGRRRSAIVAHILAAQPDIVTLQEFRNGPAGARIRKDLATAGLRHQYAPETDDPAANTLLLAARIRFEAGSFLPEETDGRCHILEAEFPAALRGAPLTLLPIHFPQKQAQLPLFAALIQDSPSLLGLNALVVGDLNCGVPFVDSDTKTFDNHREFQRLLDLGWIDAWRSRHPADREFTWVSPRTGNRFRYDHCLATPGANALIASADYDHAARDPARSDHSALLITLEA